MHASAGSFDSNIVFNALIEQQCTEKASVNSLTRIVSTEFKLFYVVRIGCIDFSIFCKINEFLFVSSG